MIRRLLLTVVLVHSTAQAVPAYLKKFYLQPELGLIRQQGELSGTFSEVGYTDRKTVKFSKFGPSAGLYLGRTFDLGENYYTISAGGSYEKVGGRKIYTSSNGAYTFRNKLSREYTVTLRGELGTHLEDNTHIFGMLEILGSEFKHDYQDNNFKTNNKKTTWGVGIGIGMRYPWTESRGFGIRYNYQMYDSYRTKDVDPNPASTYFAKITPRYHTLMATVTLSLK